MEVNVSSFVVLHLNNHSGLWSLEPVPPGPTTLNHTDVHRPHHLGVTIAKSLVMVAIMLAAVVGNILVIVSVLKFEKLRIIANSFIVSLAFADLLVAILVMPFNAIQEIAATWLFGPIICDIWNANDVLFSTASLLHLCCISMDRYIAIMDPFHYETKMTKRRVAVMLCAAWGASSLISHVPIHLGWYTTQEQKKALRNKDECTFKVNKIYAAISSSISFWIPAFIMVFAYVKIYSEARRQEKQIHAHSLRNWPDSNSDTYRSSVYSNNHHRRSDDENVSLRVGLKTTSKKMKREHKAAKTLGIIMGCFLLCWFPFFLWYVSSTMCDCVTPEVVVGFLFWVGYANSAINPIIYAFFNRDFRYAFKKLLGLQNCSCPRKRREGGRALANTYVSEVHAKFSRGDRQYLNNLNQDRLDEPRDAV